MHKDATSIMIIAVCAFLTMRDSKAGDAGGAPMTENTPTPSPAK